MKITCPAIGSRVVVQDAEEVHLLADHPRFLDQGPNDELAAVFDFRKGESAEFEIYDFQTADETWYEVEVERIEIQPNGSWSVVERWTRDGTKVVSDEYLTQQVLDLVVKARSNSSSAAPLETPCKIHVRPMGRPGRIAAE